MAERKIDIPESGLGLNDATARLMDFVDPDLGTDILEEQPAEEEAQTPDPEEAEVAEEAAVEETPEEADVEDDLEDGDNDNIDEDDDVEEADDPEEPEDSYYTVKVAGEDVEVTLTEMMAGYSRTADYTNKTQELSEHRKVVDAALQETLQERAQYAQLLPVLTAQLDASIEPEPNWDALYEQDPIGATNQKRLWDQRQLAVTERRDAIVSEQTRLNEQATSEAQQAYQRHVGEQQALLPEEIPEWVDAKRAKKESAEIRDWAIGSGLAEQAVDSVDNAKVIAMMRKAWLYDQGTAKAKGKVVRPSRTMRPGQADKSGGRKRRTAQKRSRERLAETGRVGDAAVALESFLD